MDAHPYKTALGSGVDAMDAGNGGRLGITEPCKVDSTSSCSKGIVKWVRSTAFNAFPADSMVVDVREKDAASASSRLDAGETSRPQGSTEAHQVKFKRQNAESSTSTNHIFLIFDDSSDCDT